MVVCRITSIIKRKRGQRLRKELRRALGGREELQADWEHTAVVLREAVKLFGASSGQRKYWKVRLMAKRENLSAWPIYQLARQRETEMEKMCSGLG